MKNTTWLTEGELSELTGISVELLQRGNAVGLFDGLMTVVHGERRHAPDSPSSSPDPTA